jgi:predicted ATPase
MSRSGLGPVQCPVVIGRDAELAGLAELLRQTRDGHGGVVSFIGEPGIGKSRLAREVEADAQVEGCWF